MTNTRKAFSWGLSILVHTVLLIAIIRYGYRYAFPEGDVSSGVTFEALGTAGDVAAPKAPAAPKEPAPAAPPTEDKSEVAVPIDKPAKKKAVVSKVLPEKTTKTETATEPVPLAKQVEEPAKPKEVAPPPEEQETETAAEPTPEEQAPPAVAEAPEPEQQGEEDGEDESAAAPEGEAQTAGDGSAVPKYGTPGTSLDESKLEEVFGNRKPAYPWMARLRRQEGTVIIRAYVRADGQVDLPLIQTSSGHPILDREAVSAYSKWRYKPGRAGWVVKSFIFKIKD
jgi:periplasmic protein TonB